MMRSILLTVLVSSWVPCLFSAPALMAQEGSLFPNPFRVEHHLEHFDGEGGSLAFESVTDTYGGSWIVSEHQDGSRLIVDLVRHEVIEIQPDRARFWVVSLDRLADLQARLADVDRMKPRVSEDAEVALAKATTLEPASLVIEKVSSRAGARVQGLAERPGVLHFRMARASDVSGKEPSLEAWFDPTIQLSAKAVAALDTLSLKLGGGSHDDDAPVLTLGPMRSQSGGAFAIRTSRSLADDSSGESPRIDDIATEVQHLEAFPGELLEIPEGFVRVAHPLESAVRYLEQDEEWRRQIGGGEPTS